MSYACPKNSLGNRIPPVKKRKKIKKKKDDSYVQQKKWFFEIYLIHYRDSNESDSTPDPIMPSQVNSFGSKTFPNFPCEGVRYFFQLSGCQSP